VYLGIVGWGIPHLRPPGRCKIDALAPPTQAALRTQILIILAAVLLLRLPFLNQAIQGDESYYLTGAMNAQVDPLHPTHGEFVFAGKMVSMQGHSHPPLNMWLLGGLLALFGDIDEVRFHAAYIPLSIIAALAMLVLARRFSPSPIWATLLFLAVPPFVVNGGSLEADFPFLAFWMAAMALFVAAVDRRSPLLMGAAMLAMVPAAMGAYQSVLLAPIAACYLWMRARGWKPGWIALATPAAVLGLWQLFERVTGGAMPADVLAGHFADYGFGALANRMDNAAALTVHAGWIVFPVLAVRAFWRVPRWGWALVVILTLSGAAWLDPHPLFWLTFGTGVLTIIWCLSRLLEYGGKDQWFLAAWVCLFFGAALLLFFAGSARYLLPMAAPLCLLVSRQLHGRTKWLAAGFSLQVALALALAIANYQHWDGYRRFVAGMADEFESRRVWVNSEWGLRYYAETAGAIAFEQIHPVQPGEMVLTSEIGFPSEVTAGGGARSTLRAAGITSTIPLRIIGLGSRSAYSTVTAGYRPFDIVFEPIDRVTADVIIERKPELSLLPMNAPEAESQIVSGIHRLEDNAWRWMSARGVVLLKAPPAPAPLSVSLYIPDQSPARAVTVSVDGVLAAQGKYDGPGSYTLVSGLPVAAAGHSASVEIIADKTFTPEGDERELSLILSAVGFQEEPGRQR